MTKKEDHNRVMAAVRYKKQQKELDRARKIQYQFARKAKKEGTK